MQGACGHDLGKKKKDSSNRKNPFAFVGLPGLEPGKAGPESAVLPLHHSPNKLCSRRMPFEVNWLIFPFASAKVMPFYDRTKHFREKNTKKWPIVLDFLSAHPKCRIFEV